MENLLPDTVHRPVDSLTEGGLLLSHRRGARCDSVACGVVCRGYRAGVIMGRNRVVVSNWHCRLTYAAWVAPAAALCALVTRGLQYSLTKVTSGSTAERTFVYRVA